MPDAAERKSRAFTLIELLTVLFILGLLVALVVGVSSYIISESARKQTETTQAIVMSAIQVFYDNSYPKDYPPDNDGSSGTEDSGWILMQYLKGKIIGPPVLDLDDEPPAQAAMEKLRSLPEDAYDEPSGRLAIRDGWGNEMRYEYNGGLGGRPVIISAGLDGLFGTDEPGPDDQTKMDDNIRSDGR